MTDKDSPGAPDGDDPQKHDAAHPMTPDADDPQKHDDTNPETPNADEAGTPDDDPETPDDDSGWVPVDRLAPLFNTRAAIEDYLARMPNPNYSDLAKETLERGREYMASPKFQEDALAAAQDGFERMKRDLPLMGRDLQPKARRAIQVNEKWIEADVKERAARAEDDEKAAAEHEQTKASLDTELTLIDLMQEVRASTAAMAKSTAAMAKSTAASATSLAEMEAGRKLAETDHKRQATFNKIMAFVAAGLALGSIVVGIAMPHIEHSQINPPSPSPLPVVVIDGKLTVPPLLRRLIP